MTIGKKLFLCFGVTLVIGLVSGFLGWRSVATLGKMQDALVEVDVKQLNLAHGINLGAEQLRSLQRAFVLDFYARNVSGMAENDRSFQRVRAEVEKKVVDIRGLLDSAREKEAVDRAQAVLREWSAVFEEIVRHYSSGDVHGGDWTAGAAPADSCAAARPTKAVATRSSQLTGVGTAAGSQLVETVSTHRGVAAAVAAVHALERRLTGCHGTGISDPRIGDASVQAKLTAADGTVTIVTAAAVEGVTFVLSGSGPVTSARRWSALTDIALGSTCVASIDGCH